MEVEGMSDMEAHALLAKSGPIAHLAIVKNAFLWRGNWQADFMNYLVSAISYGLLCNEMTTVNISCKS